ncbi:GSCFA domain-containing protein [Flavobacterium sp. PL002]|uniref:GSCFA domain-containing protein n=1 Tax=Flavobacterium sp. PL002 TaxID=1897058 RepID=UPI00178861B2|nr:GSCFA domain-containing protein [Flavobacterium sp. PL002]MBE0391497.1 hypothetical protein [Flavobacterium sp. PL002]
MHFTTQIPISKSLNPIDYKSKIISLGSCFAENMGSKFQYFKLQSETNLFGIIFNSASIEKIIERVVREKEFTEEDIFYHNEQWHCYDIHSDLSNSNKELFLEDLNQILKSMTQQLIDSSHIIITYGTSWVYRNTEKNSIVANCHKVPQKQFTKELLSIDTIEKSIQNTIDLIGKINLNCTIIFTISPVRHLKDGFVENQRSKSHLITAIHNIIKTEHYKLNTEYFPSYEIMMDELRDYRFYNADMLHPNQVAIDYIWERFAATTITEATHETMEFIATIQKSLQHRPFNPGSESHQKFEANLHTKIAKMVSQYSFMKF